MRNLVAAACVVLIAASCGGRQLTLTEYAEQVEGHTTTLYQTLDTLTTEGTFEAPTVDETQAVYTGLAAAFHRLSDGLEAVEPPQDVAELHSAALAMATSLTAAGDAFAQRALDVETEAELSELFESPEAHEVEGAVEKMVTFCLERQAEFDATADREVFADTPWIPPEMQEVVLVAFGCETAGSGG